MHMCCRVGGTGWSSRPGVSAAGELHTRELIPWSRYPELDEKQNQKTTSSPGLGIRILNLTLVYCQWKFKSNFCAGQYRSLSFLSIIRKSSLEEGLGGQLVQLPAQSRASFHQATQAKKSRIPPTLSFFILSTCLRDWIVFLPHFSYTSNKENTAALPSWGIRFCFAFCPGLYANGNY